MTEEHKTVNLVVRFSPSEKEAIIKASKYLRLSLTDYVRMVTIAPSTATTKAELVDAFNKVAGQAISYLPNTLSEASDET